MTMAESDQLVEALKEIRDELRALRTELGGRSGRMAASGVRTERVELGVRRRNVALAGGGLAALALVLGLALRDHPAPEPVTAVAPQASAANSATPRSMPAPAPPVIQAPAPVALAAPVPAPAAMPVAKPLAGALAPATRKAARLPAAAPASTAIASVSAPDKKRVKPEVPAKTSAEVASDEDETLAFPPPPRRVRVHRLSYGPVESEPAKL
jgi:hypothetical protein